MGSENLTYLVTVTNNGPIDATGVTVEDTLQAPFVSDDCGGVDGDPWTWAIGNLMVGDSAVCNITVDVSGFAPGDSLENQASLLQFLEKGEYRWLGDSRLRTAPDVRIVDTRLGARPSPVESWSRIFARPQSIT